MTLIRSLFPGKRNDDDRPEPKRVDDLILYHYPSCFFCTRVRRVVEQLNVTLDQRDIIANPDYRQELIAGGGRSQVPCLRLEPGDGSQHWMYESRDIIRYLEERFG